MNHKPLIVVKIGTKAITTTEGDLDGVVLDEIVRQVVVLQKNFHVLLVSSGAVGCGRHLLKPYSGTVSDQKAAAALGNPLLLEAYREAFDRFDQRPVAQALCERRHFSDRGLFLQLCETFTTLWKSGVVIVVNENDVVSDAEIRFSDNDELAAMIAMGFSAHQLLLGTNVEGVMKDGIVQRELDSFEDLAHVSSETSRGGRGGMKSKIECAAKAAGMGTEVVIFDICQKGGILKAHEKKTGTFCSPKTCALNARQRWIGLGGNLKGRVYVDGGAKKALKSRNSLLLVGVQSCEGAFETGDLVEIFEVDNPCLVGIGRTEMGIDKAREQKGNKGVTLVRANDLVLIDEHQCLIRSSGERKK